MDKVTAKITVSGALLSSHDKNKDLESSIREKFIQFIGKELAKNGIEFTEDLKILIKYTKEEDKNGYYTFKASVSI